MPIFIWGSMDLQVWFSYVHNHKKVQFIDRVVLFSCFVIGSWMIKNFCDCCFAWLAFISYYNVHPFDVYGCNWDVLKHHTRTTITYAVTEDRWIMYSISLFVACLMLNFISINIGSMCIMIKILARTEFLTFNVVWRWHSYIFSSRCQLFWRQIDFNKC